MMQQDFIPINIRAATILTNAFVAGTVISAFNNNPALKNQLNLLLSFLKGSLTSLDIKIEYSNDGTTYYQETFETITGGAAAMSLGLYNFTADGNYVISIPIKASYIRVSALGNGTVTSSSLLIDGALGTV